MGRVAGGQTPSWDDSDVVARYATEGYSDAGERVALEAAAEWARGDVLDLGVGGGRTTGLLADGARTYIGIDSAAEQLVTARRRFPTADLRLGDARRIADLPGRPDRGFDLVVFSFNGLDSLDHPGRATALAEMAAAVAADGRVVFSSLNLDGVSYDERPWRFAGVLRSPRSRHHLLQAVKHPNAAVRGVQNFRRWRDRGEDGDDWGRRLLRAHEFRFVAHFATLGEMVAGAAAAGLDVLAVYADDGMSIDPASTRTDADYVHLVCRRTS